MSLCFAGNRAAMDCGAGWWRSTKATVPRCDRLSQISLTKQPFSSVNSVTSCLNSRLVLCCSNRSAPLRVLRPSAFIPRACIILFDRPCGSPRAQNIVCAGLKNYRCPGQVTPSDLSAKIIRMTRAKAPVAVNANSRLNPFAAAPTQRPAPPRHVGAQWQAKVAGGVVSNCGCHRQGSADVHVCEFWGRPRPQFRSAFRPTPLSLTLFNNQFNNVLNNLFTTICQRLTTFYNLLQSFFIKHKTNEYIRALPANW